MKKFFFLPLLALLFLAVSCPPQDNPPIPDALPPLTQSGANTFGCLVNGKVWLPGAGPLPAFNPQYYQGVFSVGTDKGIKNTNGQLIDWAVSPVRDTGKYYIKTGRNYLGANFTDHVNNIDYEVKDIDSMQNWLRVSKLDSAHRIISGTFNLYFTAPGHDTVRITQGRFDAKYTY